jgi:thiopeptide-type bacteriocin biosynthesis protein
MEWSGACRAAFDSALADRAAPDPVTRARAASRAWVAELCRDSVVREALFIGSPDLEGSLDAWLGAPDADRSRKLERALVRYFIRMASRCTPFGLFAGCSVGAIGEQTRFSLGPVSRHRRRSRIDVEYVDALCTAWALVPEVRCRLHVRPNSSLYRAAGRLRYVEVQQGERRRVHQLSSVRDSPALRTVLSAASGGATIAQLVERLVATGITTAERAEGYVDELLTEQVLVPDLTVTTTGKEPAEALIATLRTAWPDGDWEPLVAAVAGLAAIDRGPPGVAPRRYRELAEPLRSLPAEVELGRLFHVDMVKPASELMLAAALVDELSRVAHAVVGITPRRDELAPFREAFTARYETRMVPLAEALDEDIGVGLPGGGPRTGYREPLLDGLPFPSTAQDERDWGPRDRLLLGHLARALERGAEEIVLSKTDLAALAAKRPALVPRAIALIATLAAASPEALARGDCTMLMKGVMGPSGAQLLGRFCYADPELRRHVEEHLRAEERLHPGAVLAEIVHLPEGRMGNVICRPVLRDWEIPYLGRSGAPEDHQLPLQDLHVTVRHGRVILWSERLRCRVIPRLTSAHNIWSPATPIYRFLGLLQFQESAGAVGWDWGPLADAPFLPRVRHGRVVLARAVWRVSGDEILALGRAADAERFFAAQELRNRRHLPRFVTFGPSYQQLVADLDNPVSVEVMVEMIKRLDETLLSELWPEPELLCAHGPEGRFTHELVIPLIQEPVSGGRRRANGREVVSAVRRSFPPGSEWLYAKLYCGAANADRVLEQVIRPVLDAGLVDRWFFIRYADPDQHIRVRFHGDPAALQHEVMPAIEEVSRRLLADGLAHRLVFDCYEREVERYGGALGIELAERVFHADSEAVLTLLSMLEPGDRGFDERWRIALCGADMLLDDLCGDDVVAVEVLTALRTGLGAEFEVDANLRRALGRKFREERAGLEAAFSDELRPGDGLEPGVAILRRRSERLAPIWTELANRHTRGELSAGPSELAGHFMHMHVNRMLRAEQRRQEFVIYDFLLRLRRSREARR